MRFHGIFLSPLLTFGALSVASKLKQSDSQKRMDPQSFFGLTNSGREAIFSHSKELPTPLKKDPISRIRCLS